MSVRVALISPVQIKSCIVNERINGFVYVFMRVVLTRSMPGYLNDTYIKNCNLCKWL